MDGGGAESGVPPVGAAATERCNVDVLLHCGAAAAGGDVDDWPELCRWAADIRFCFDLELDCWDDACSCDRSSCGIGDIEPPVAVAAAACYGVEIVGLITVIYGL